MAIESGTVDDTAMRFHVGRLIDHIHLRVADLEASRRFYRAVLQAIGRDFTGESPGHFAADNGKPGERPYHPGYYGAFVLDPDGNNIEAAHHGPAARSAPSVILTPRG